MTGVDPLDFEAVEKALLEREAEIGRLADLHALEAAREEGEELLVRLRLARAAVQADLQALQREGQLLNALERSG